MSVCKQGHDKLLLQFCHIMYESIPIEIQTPHLEVEKNVQVSVYLVSIYS